MHPAAKQPANPNVHVWRYMDFTKFVAMLENQGIFFPPASRLGDPFEGSYSRYNQMHRQLLCKELQLPEDHFATESAFVKWARDFTYVSCWHMSEKESAGMWRLYTQTSEAVAVRSRYSSLKSAVEERQPNTLVGTVQYIDYETDWVPQFNAFHPFFHKRKSFEHEREARAVFTVVPDTAEGNFDASAECGPGRWVTVDLQQVIEAVFVAPTAPPWFYELVQKVCLRYGLTQPVHRSSLDQEPFW